MLCRTTRGLLFAVLGLAMSGLSPSHAADAVFLRQIDGVYRALRSRDMDAAFERVTGSPVKGAHPGQVPGWGADGPGVGLTFKSLAPANHRTDPRWGPKLTDIVNHEAPWDSNPYDDLVTKAHETTHGINAHIRNTMREPGQTINGFYVFDDRAVVIPEPKLRKSQVAAYVPKSLRSSKYQTYIVGQTGWDDRPLYIFDEWVAYTNGGVVAVDLVERGLWKAGWRDAVSGQLEFSAFAMAAAMAVRELDPEYWASCTQFREFLAWNMKRAMDNYRVGSRMEQFRWDKQDEFFKSFREGPDGAALRGAARDLFGEDWTRDVMGF